jgi:hypothetical protein
MIHADQPDGSERRQRRSEDPLVALHYQLSSARARGELAAIVVADVSGVVVAGAGSWPVCEELAAYAPLLADGAWAEMSAPVSSRVDTLRRDAIVRAMHVGGQEILLCARRQSAGDASASASDATTLRELDEAAAGVSRILMSAA